ncbi:restriction endonuclease subunit S [Corynebacterium afermentans]|uniref:restriction endonuclease subunit S n=1 Tax=Corynebacterium afermentans TaxID=38286 RepID=UPI0025747E9A|nr:restriction endonuclease subunit S [Corynebacterium afermentans]MCG7290878.1 restriction endonuclease subunit S [Corynebacterium afermentans]
MSDKLAPELRLNGFEDDWTTGTLGTLAQVVGGGTPSTTTEEFWNGSIPWFTPAEISKTGSGIVSESARMITPEGLQGSSAKLLPPRSVLVTSRASIGHAAVNALPCATNQGFASLVPYDSRSLWFLYNWALSHQKELEQNASGSTFLEIKASSMAGFRTAFPGLDEQAAIGKILKNLDVMVRASRKRLNSLQHLRQTMLVKMFPHGDSLVPDIRFGGFSGVWEMVPFTEIAQRRGVSAVAGCDGHGVEFEDLNAGEGTLKPEWRYKQISKPGLRFEPGDILYGKLRPYLRNWLLADFNGVAVGDFWVLRPVDGVSDFVYRLLQTPRFEDVANIVTGSKMPRADWGIVSQSLFAVPSPEEQQVIGNYFKNLDDLIHAEAVQVTKLQNLNTALISKMFI